MRILGIILICLGVLLLIAVFGFWALAIWVGGNDQRYTSTAAELFMAFVVTGGSGALCLVGSADN